MEEDPIEAVSKTLRMPGSKREQIVRELRSHLDASRHDLQLAGKSADEATRESLKRFGDPAEVSAMLTEVHRRRIPRVQSVAAGLMILVALSAWLGTSHTFASTGGSHHRPSPACHVHHGAKLHHGCHK